MPDAGLQPDTPAPTASSSDQGKFSLARHAGSRVACGALLPEFSAPTDRFVLESRAGSGGMGDIFKGTDRETGKHVAVKLLRSTASAHERARFAREIAILADLRHPNIVQYVAHGTWHDGRLFFAMEWLDGEDLGVRQRRAPLGMRDAVEVVRRAAAAMAAVHARGVIHRDLKMSNIFLVQGKGTAVKLIDFGVVRLAEPDEYPTAQGTIIGTPHFMAPEQARGRAIDARADVYSLGSVLFRLVTGRNVFETEHIVALLARLVVEDPPSPMSIRFDTPEALDIVIRRSIARNAEERFDNGGELARALARVGQLNNDPPGTDRSASAIRKHLPGQKPITITTTDSAPQPASRPGSGERRVVAVVLFALGGASMTPEIDTAVREVLGEDTRLEPLLGGQMVAVLGVARSTGDEAMRAARAALTLTQALPEARVAVAIGLAIRGRANLAGQALERAAEQLEMATPGAVRADSHAARTLEGRFVLQEDAQGAWLLREDLSGFGARKLLGRPTPTIGREKEIALLQSIFSEIVDDGTPRAGLVLGPAGIGKSRVRAELMQRLEMAPSPPQVLVCRGDPMSRGSSLSALGRAIRTVMGIRDGEPLADQVYKVQQHVNARVVKGYRFLSAFFGELAGVNFPDHDDEQLRAARSSVQIMQARLRMALEAFVRAETGKAPQVLIIEDMHWADDTTIDLVDWLLDCPDLCFGVFAFARPELVSRLPALWERRNLTRLTLSPLAPLAADKLVTAVLPNIDPIVRGNLVQRAGGNPLFLEELVRSAAEGRNELPLTVQALIQLRLDRMSPHVREVVRAASVFGQAFWTAGLKALLERDVASELAELEAAEIITREPEPRIAGNEEWVFRQTLVREAAYASLVDEDRALLHLAAGNWLESAGDVDVGLIARHADAGGDMERAAALYARATRQAYTHGAQLETALSLAERGLVCGAAGGVRAQLLLAKAQASHSLGLLQDAVTAAEQAAECAPAGSDMWAEAQRLAAVALTELGRSAEGEARAGWALGSDSLSAPMRAMLLAARVRGLVDLSRPTEALAVANQAVETAQHSGSLDAMVRALDARLFALLHAGELSAVVEVALALIDAAENAGDIVSATRGRMNIGSVLNHLGMFEQAQAILERALSDSQARRMRILEAFALHNLGMSHARLGNLDAAIDYERQAQRLGDECNAARLRIHARVYETIFLVWRGAPGDLSAALSLARYLHQETRNLPALEVNGCFTLARVQLARRAFDSALESARDAMHILAAGPIEEWEEYIRLTFIEALLAVGETEEADMALQAAFNALVRRVQSISRADYREAFVRRNEEVYRIAELAYGRLGLTFPVGAGM